VLSLGESFRVESENAALDGLRMLPTNARAIFLGKAVGNALMIFALSLVLLPVMVAIYDVGFSGQQALYRILELKLGGVPIHVEVSGVTALLLCLLLGCLSISAPGTVYAAIATNARARDVLLPLLLFPMLVPALLADVKATALVLQGDPMNQLPSWLGLLAGFNLIYWGLGFTLFPKVIED
jgi:heme exporter protein B